MIRIIPPVMIITYWKNKCIQTIRAHTTKFDNIGMIQRTEYVRLVRQLCRRIHISDPVTIVRKVILHKFARIIIGVSCLLLLVWLLPVVASVSS